MYKNYFRRKHIKKRNKAIDWDDECEKAFRRLKEILHNHPILANADFSKQFKLHTDACTLGLGAILYQNQDGVDHIIGYASRSLSKTECKYLGHKLEFLTFQWAIREQFHDYLYGNNLAVYTDNDPLTYILTSTKVDVTGHYWVAG